MEPESQIAVVAAGMIKGAIDLFEGCRLIARLGAMIENQKDRDDEDRLVLIGVASEIEDLPLGKERELWSPAGLEAKVQQQEEYLTRARPEILVACEALVTKYGSLKGISVQSAPN